MLRSEVAATLLLLIVVLLAAEVCGLDSAESRPRIIRAPRMSIPRYPFPLGQGHPGQENCTEHWFTQTTDHFGWATPPLGKDTFQQRYFVCDLYWRGGGGARGGTRNPDAEGAAANNESGSLRAGSGASAPSPSPPPPPIFFYAGNEADVTLYVNATGLMWESAPEFGALLVFVEHRYFGKTLPFGADTPKYMDYLSSEQALADYATIIPSIKQHFKADDSAVITFGGSYGGMLSAWFRLKYPGTVDGAIAASAPIWSFLGEEPACDQNGFAKIVTRDASAAGGASDDCSNNIHTLWPLLFADMKTEGGRAQISEAFRLCRPARDEADVLALIAWLQDAYDYMAMGDFPYPSSYILNGHGTLPAFPVEVACGKVGRPGGYPHRAQLFAAMGEAVNVFYNSSGERPCNDQFHGVNNDTSQDALFWDYLWCTEMVQPFVRNGVDDMFFPQPFNLSASTAHCQQQWGVTPRPSWITVQYGGKRLQAASNIFFTNGELDPWRSGGVVEDVSDSVQAYVIARGAHHLDLMFSNPDDPQSVKTAREQQRSHIRKWIAERASAVPVSEQWRSARSGATKLRVQP